MQRICVLCVLVGTGCGGDKTPAQKCDDLVSIVCDRGVECIPGGGTKTECVQAVQQRLPCGSAKTIGASYNRCVSMLRTDSCAILFPQDPQTGDPTLSLPADCVGVIQMFEPPGAPTGSTLDGVSWMGRTAAPE